MADSQNRFRQFNSGRANFFLVAIITLLACGAALKLTAPVILPFTIAVLLAFVLQPLVAIPERLRIPRIFSILLALVVISVGLFVFGVVLFTSVRSILTSYPKYEDRIIEIYRQLGRFFELTYDEHLTVFENIWGQLGIRTRIQLTTLSFSNAFLSFLQDAMMVVLFVVFILFEASVFKRKIDAAFEGRHADQIKNISAAVMRQITRYLSIKFLISLATGVIVWVGLELAGLQFAVLWGIIQFIMNFIPTLGSIACGVGVSAFALIQFWPDPAPVIIVVIIMLASNMIIGNLIEPKIMGDNLGLSPLVVLLSLTIWGWLWGFAGMVMAVPMTMIIKIICENVPMLEPVSILLGSRKAVMSKKP